MIKNIRTEISENWVGYVKIQIVKQKSIQQNKLSSVHCQLNALKDLSEEWNIVNKINFHTIFMLFNHKYIKSC